MADLASLIAKQKANSNATDESKAVDSQPVSEPKPKATGGLSFLKNASQSKPLEAAKESAPVSGTTGGGKAGGGLSFLKRAATGSAGSGGNTDSVPKPNGLPSAGGNGDRDATAYAGASSRVSGGSLDDLSSLMASTEADESQSLGGFVSRFADHVEATAPVRDLPEDIESGIKQFAESLDSVYGLMHEPEMLGSVIRNIMIELGRHPEYRRMIQPVDTNTMVRGMRESMGLARVKKEESKAKRSGGTKKKVQIDDLDVLAALNDIGPIE